MSPMDFLDWLPTIIWCSIGLGLVSLVARIVTLEWLPRCPICNQRGYKEICAVSSMRGVDALNATDAEMNWREIRRCKHCRVHRMNGPGGRQDLSWNNWRREVSRVMRDDRR